MVASGIVSHMEMMGHMPMFTQKLSNIFHFFDLDSLPKHEIEVKLYFSLSVIELSLALSRE